MVLEATMICVDNSEWMRNGDYQPTRFQAQADAINFLAGAKTQDNPENTVGVLTLAGKGPRVLVTPTADLGKILGAMHGIEMESDAWITSGVQVAQLALKHRQNKNQRQRVVLFVGSPMEADEQALVKIGKKLKKNNVAIDIVNFGDEDGSNTTKLESFLGAVNNNDNSHLVTVPLGATLADSLLSSPIFNSEGGGGGSGFAAAAAAGAGGGDFEYGFERVDPNLDPELALALRVSMEEERARQEAQAKKEGEEGGAEASGAGDAAGSETVPMDTLSGDETPATQAEDVPMDDDALLQQALALSMQDAMDTTDEVKPSPADPTPAGFTDEIEGGTEDAELALAIQMSMADQEGAPMEQDQTLGTHDLTQVLGDADFMTSMLGTLPGVDPNNPAVRDALASLGATNEEKEEEEDKKE